jgi:hypothetical protein
VWPFVEQQVRKVRRRASAGIFQMPYPSRSIGKHLRGACRHLRCDPFVGSADTSAELFSCHLCFLCVCTPQVEYALIPNMCGSRQDAGPSDHGSDSGPTWCCHQSQRRSTRPSFPVDRPSVCRPLKLIAPQNPILSMRRRNGFQVYQKSTNQPIAASFYQVPAMRFRENPAVTKRFRI